MIKIIFIAGDGRSGSTLLESILSNGNNCVSVGECHRFWKRFVENSSQCGCAMPINDCKLWGAVHQKLTDEFPDYDPVNFQKEVQDFQRYKNFKQLPGSLGSERWTRFSEIVSAFYRAIAHFSEKNTIIDSSKSIPWARLLQLNDQFDVRVIHLERQLSQVANSWKKRILLPEYSNSEVYMPTKSNALILKSWLKVKIMARSLPKGGAYLFLRYEKFLKHPKQSIERMVKFTEIELDIDDLTYQLNHAIGGNPMRHGAQGTIEFTTESAADHNLSYLERIGFSVVHKLASFVGP